MQIYGILKVPEVLVYCKHIWNRNIIIRDFGVRYTGRHALAERYGQGKAESMAENPPAQAGLYYLRLRHARQFAKTEKRSTKTQIFCRPFLSFSLASPVHSRYPVRRSDVYFIFSMIFLYAPLPCRTQLLTRLNVALDISVFAIICE